MAGVVIPLCQTEGRRQGYNFVQAPSPQQGFRRSMNSTQSFGDLREKAKKTRVSCGNFELAFGSASSLLTRLTALLRSGFSPTSLLLMLLITLSARVQAEPPQSMDASQVTAVAPHGAKQYTLASTEPRIEPARKLIVIGFMGGKVSATNLVHREAQLIGTLQQGYPHSIHAAIFANRDGRTALKTVLQLLDEDQDGELSDAEKSAARIVIFGHSWGASETVTLAGRLNKLQIPVLLTIQVDSVQKQSQNDGRIPPNVQEAVNFYQSEGLLRGRNLIVAEDPNKTKILGNHESSYRENSVSCAGFPWYARAFMKRHIQIENDPAVWSKIEELILARIH
jgi:hypothetical protein